MNEAKKEAIANAEAHLNNAGLKLAVYVVSTFPVFKGVRRMEMHHVAGFSSEDAERRMKACAMSDLVGDCYITTDDAADRYGSAVQKYVTKWTRSESISDDEYRRWVESTAEPWDCDGETHAPTVRRFHAYQAVYTAGIGWQYEDGHGRHGNFKTEAAALAAAASHARGELEALW